jgi:hypothetical protein
MQCRRLGAAGCAIDGPVETVNGYNRGIAVEPP